jgi:trehalose utilization protein
LTNMAIRAPQAGVEAVTVWNEHRHERIDEAVRRVYPDGLHAPIANALREEGLRVGIAALDDPEHGLTEQVLAETDVLIWWGAHGA